MTIDENDKIRKLRKEINNVETQINNIKEVIKGEINIFQKILFFHFFGIILHLMEKNHRGFTKFLQEVC